MNRFNVKFNFNDQEVYLLAAHLWWSMHKNWEKSKKNRVFLQTQLNCCFQHSISLDAIKKKIDLNELNLGLFFSFTMSIQINQRPFNNADQSSLEKQSNLYLSINSLLFGQNDRESSFYVRHNKWRSLPENTSRAQANICRKSQQQRWAAHVVVDFRNISVSLYNSGIA